MTTDGDKGHQTTQANQEAGQMAIDSGYDSDLPVGFGSLCDQTQEQADHSYTMNVAAGLIKVRDPSTPLDERVVALAGNATQE